jgi:hypothetical protein
MKSSMSIAETLDHERRNFTKLKLALVSSLAPLHEMKEVKERIQ